jgi:ABC-type Fe3+-citrate transport system substrate-binding protein
MRILILLSLNFLISACSNVNSKAIEYREVHIEAQKGAFQLGDNANRVDVTEGEKMINIQKQKKFDFFYDKPVA